LQHRAERTDVNIDVPRYFSLFGSNRYYFLMIIHLVRHGQTQIGEDGLYLPHAGLTDLGRLQATQAAQRIAELRPQASFTSTLPRAIETASAFTKITGQEARQIPNLAELDTGNIWDAPDPIKLRISNGG
jgi:broad specificity phosphatase PhoE